MDVAPEKLRELCPRFRVLIMGRRNAGKTTLLEKMTASEEGAKPEIRDKNGDLVVCALFFLHVISVVDHVTIGQSHNPQGRVGGTLLKHS